MFIDFFADLIVTEGALFQLTIGCYGPPVLIQPNYWIGLMREESAFNTFVWTDGTPFDYNAWSQSQRFRSNSTCQLLFYF